MSGTFSHRFTIPGDYYYTTDEVMNLSPYQLRGVIHVREPEQMSAALSLKVNGAQAVYIGSVNKYIYIGEKVGGRRKKIKYMYILLSRYITYINYHRYDDTCIALI